MRFVEPDAIVFDIGSGLGFYALLASHAGADVIAFEPNPVNAESVVRHLELNHLADPVRVIRQAVFYRTGSLRLKVSEGTSGHQNAKVLAGPADRTTGVILPCISLDDFIANNPKPSVVKIDVEGAESDVLKGADQLFRTYRPMLLCEVHDETNAQFAEKWLRESSRWLEKVSDFPKHLLGSPRENSGE